MGGSVALARVCAASPPPPCGRRIRSAAAAPPHRQPRQHFLHPALRGKVAAGRPLASVALVPACAVGPQPARGSTTPSAVAAPAEVPRDLVRSPSRCTVWRGPEHRFETAVLDVQRRFMLEQCFVIQQAATAATDGDGYLAAFAVPRARVVALRKRGLK